MLKTMRGSRIIGSGWSGDAQLMVSVYTHEYPYAECTNAAQIYRKVMAGDADSGGLRGPPGSLGLAIAYSIPTHFPLVLHGI